MKKNIWYVSKYVSPLEFGFATRHFYFCKEFEKKGYNTLIITSDSNHTSNIPNFSETYNYTEHDGVKTIWCKTIRYKDTLSFKRIMSWIDFERRLFFLDTNKLPKPDAIIISSLSLFTILNGILWKRKFNCRLAFEVRDIWPLTITSIGSFKRSNLFVRLLSYIEKKGYKKADVIIGTMPNLKEHVKNIIGSSSNVFHIPQGLNESLYENPEPLDEDYIKKYIPKDKQIICYAGSIGRSNALETILNVADSLKDDSIHFLFVGDGDLKDRFQNQYGDSPNITFAPKIKKKQVQSLLNRCDFLYDSVKKTSLYDFGLSRNKWIDYMYSEKPVIVSYSGYRSMINEAGCGIFVESENEEELANAIHRLSKLDEDNRREIGQKGREWLIENRKFENLAEDYLKLLKL